jgi:hypothetical protein
MAENQEAKPRDSWRAMIQKAPIIALPESRASSDPAFAPPICRWHEFSHYLCITQQDRDKGSCAEIGTVAVTDGLVAVVFRKVMMQ